MVLLLAACSPRELPPQLAYTPGPAYRLDGQMLITERYSVETPGGWRVIAGPAEDPYTFQFVAPDNEALIVLSDHRIENPPQPLNATASTLAIRRAEAQTGEGPLYAVLTAPAEDIGTQQPVLETLMESIR